MKKWWLVLGILVVSVPEIAAQLSLPCVVSQMQPPPVVLKSCKTDAALVTTTVSDFGKKLTSFTNLQAGFCGGEKALAGTLECQGEYATQMNTVVAKCTEAYKACLALSPAPPGPLELALEEKCDKEAATETTAEVIAPAEAAYKTCLVDVCTLQNKLRITCGEKL